MPFEKVSAMDQKTLFIADYLNQVYPHSVLCEKYGVSRPTGYKWISRYESEGPPGLIDRSCRPHHCPQEISQDVVSAIVALRKAHTDWGAKKLIKHLRGRFSSDALPARSTCCEILSRHGLVRKKRRKRQIGHPGERRRNITAPNQLWTADYKGQFKTRDGRYCYPLTVLDSHSRYLLGCQVLTSTCLVEAKPVFRRVFAKYGLPDRLLTDNGVPFAAHSLGRLSQLSAWWVRLGIRPELIEPGNPQQNGRHERFHRTLKDKTARPPAGSRSAQQRRFNQFQIEYNEVRPHEALDLETPSTVYTPSSRPMPAKLPPLDYPGHWEKRKVATNRSMKWRGHPVHVSLPCAGQYIGLEEVQDGIWHVYYGPIRLGTFIEEQLQIVDHFPKKGITKV